MGVELWVTLLSALIGGGGLIGSLIVLPKIRAEARKLNAEAGEIEWRSLKAEIKRLDGELDEVRRENRLLRGENRRLTRRVDGLESILKLQPPTPEMEQLIAELDRKTANGGSGK